MFGEGLEGEVGVEVVEGGEWGVGVGEAGVGEAGQGVMVAVRGVKSAFAILVRAWDCCEDGMRSVLGRRALRVETSKTVGEREGSVEPTRP